MPLHLVPVFYAMAVAVTDLSILVGGMIASMQREASQNLPQATEETSQDPKVASEHPGDADGHTGQELDGRQASTLAARLDVETVSAASIGTAETDVDAVNDNDNDNDNDTDTDSVSTLVDESNPPGDAKPRAVVVASNTGKVIAQSTEGEDQALRRLSPRKRPASSITSLLESGTSHDPPGPLETLRTGLMIESSPVASGSRLSGDFGYVHAEPLLVHEEEPASKKRIVESASGPWMKKVVLSTRHKLSDLRPRNYSRRFRKQITPFPMDREISSL